MWLPRAFLSGNRGGIGGYYAGTIARTVPLLARRGLPTEAARCGMDTRRTTSTRAYTRPVLRALLWRSLLSSGSSAIHRTACCKEARDGAWHGVAVGGAVAGGQRL